MKPVLLLVVLGTVLYSASAEDIVFTNRTATFTDLQGRSYRKVQLVRGDLDGLIWRNGASGGRICYTNLDPDLLESFGISTNRIEVARARAEKKAIADARYRSMAFSKAQSRSPNQTVPTNTVASAYAPAGPPPMMPPSVPYDYGYPYPPQYIYGFGVPTLAPSAPTAMSSASAPGAANAAMAPNAAQSFSAGPAANVAAAPSIPPALSAPSAPSSAPIRRR